MTIWCKHVHIQKTWYDIRNWNHVKWHCHINTGYFEWQITNWYKINTHCRDIWSYCFPHQNHDMRVTNKHETLNQWWSNVGRRRRRWPNITPALVQCFVFVWNSHINSHITYIIDVEKVITDLFVHANERIYMLRVDLYGCVMVW